MAKTSAYERNSAGDAALICQIGADGHRDYSALTPTFASAVKEAEPMILASLSSMGALKSIKFRSVTVGGMDNYQVEFERGSADWFITPLTSDGKINGMGWRRVP